MSIAYAPEYVDPSQIAILKAAGVWKDSNSPPLSALTVSLADIETQTDTTSLIHIRNESNCDTQINNNNKEPHDTKSDFETFTTQITGMVSKFSHKCGIINKQTYNTHDNCSNNNCIIILVIIRINKRKNLKRRRKN